MGLPLIQMETISRLTGKIHKASQGGLTSPKLSDSGLDFRIAVAKNTEGRQVRISCKNVTDRLSSVVFISHPNQLQKCLSSVAKMFYRISCRNVTVARMSHITIRRLSSGKFVTVAEMSHLGPNRTYRPRITPQTPPVEIRNQTPQWKSSPLRGNLGLTPPVEICKVIRS